VRRGSFGYRARGVLSELVAGSLLVGHPGDEYVCTHDHAVGDECLFFQLTPALAESMGGRRDVWRTGAVPPLPELMVLGELARAAAWGRPDVRREEGGLLRASRMVGVVSPRSRTPATVDARDRRRAVEAALWLDAHAHEPVGLEAVADAVDLSAFHFLRLFARVLGVTPHQYLVRVRLRHAAALLAGEAPAITERPADGGLGELSHFVRTFRRAAGVSPRGFRRLARGDRTMLQERLGARS